MSGIFKDIMLFNNPNNFAWVCYFPYFLQRRKLKFKNMKKFSPSHTAREFWSFNSNPDFSDSNIQFSEKVTLELGPEERVRLAQ